MKVEIFSTYSYLVVISNFEGQQIIFFYTNVYITNILCVSKSRYINIINLNIFKHNRLIDSLNLVNYLILEVNKKLPFGIG